MHSFCGHGTDTEGQLIMAVRLDEKVVRRLEAPATGNRITYDEEVKGFGVRITAAGAKAFVLNYRIGNIDRRITIGAYPDWTAPAARDKAKELKRRVDNGEDPMRDRHEQRTAPTVSDLAQLYRERHLPKKRPSSRLNDEISLSRHILPRLGKQRLADVRRTDIAKLHREVSKAVPIAANRCLSLLSKMFALAIAEEWLRDNPVTGVERNPENRRQRYLVAEEIARLGEVLAVHPERASCNAIRLLLLTGARRGEVLSATWSQFNLGQGIWTKPAASTKQGTQHRVPVSAAVLALLEEMRAAAIPGCPYLFPGVRSVDAKGKATYEPLKEVKRAWAAVCRQAGLEGVRLHDLRHTFASVLVSSGLSLPTIGAMLGHTQSQTTQRYAHLMDDPLRAAAEHVGAVVSGAVQPGAEVVPIRRRASV